MKFCNVPNTHTKTQTQTCKCAGCVRSHCRHQEALRLQGRLLGAGRSPRCAGGTVACGVVPWIDLQAQFGNQRRLRIVKLLVVSKLRQSIILLLRLLPRMQP